MSVFMDHADDVFPVGDDVDLAAVPATAALPADAAVPERLVVREAVVSYLQIPFSVGLLDYRAQRVCNDRVLLFKLEAYKLYLIVFFIVCVCNASVGKRVT